MTAATEERWASTGPGETQTETVGRLARDDHRVRRALARARECVLERGPELAGPVVEREAARLVLAACSCRVRPPRR